MKYTNPVDFPGIQTIKDNIQYYTRKFIEDGILVFRNAFLSNDEQDELQLVMGDEGGFCPNHTTPIFDDYVENHSRLTDIGELTKEDIIIRWHIEHQYYDNPIVAAFGNMNIFKTPYDHGNTLFVDSISLINSLPLEDQLFLKQCVVKEDPIAVTYKEAYKLFDHNLDFIYPILSPHWLTGESVLRMIFLITESDSETLYEVNGRKPTQQDNNRLNAIKNFIVHEVQNNLNIRLIHQWQEGDLIIPDLHRMIHTVQGGFNPEDRKFRGLGAYQKDLDKNPRVEVDLRLDGKEPWNLSH